MIRKSCRLFFRLYFVFGPNSFFSVTHWSVYILIEPTFYISSWWASVILDVIFPITHSCAVIHFLYQTSTCQKCCWSGSSKCSFWKRRKFGALFKETLLGLWERKECQNLLSFMLGILDRKKILKNRSESVEVYFSRHWDKTCSSVVFISIVARIIESSFSKVM